jgi:serine/threonine-protein kinase
VLICSKCFNLLPDDVPQCPHCRERRPTIGWERETYLGQLLLDRWEVVQRIGAGATGAVYIAHDRRAAEGEERRVAVKFLHRRHTQDENLQLRFKREALASTQISHPCVAGSLAFGELPDRTFFLVMEYVEGLSLDRYVNADPPLPLPSVVDLALQIAEGLEAAHEAGVVHRDLKPANVLLVRRPDHTWSVKILDFGYALIKARERGAVKLTKTGIIVGTPTYMAPEQTEGKRDVDGRADLYALGVILYRLLSGRRPFEADSLMDLVIKLRTETPKPPGSVAPARGIPRELDAIVMKLLERKRERRYATAHEVREVLWPFSSAGSFDWSRGRAGAGARDAGAPAASSAAASAPEPPSSLPPLPAAARSPAPAGVPAAAPGIVPAGSHRSGLFVVIAAVVAALAILAALLAAGVF